ncbi:MAG: DinB family protein [Chitinophagales bacterium]
MQSIAFELEAVIDQHLTALRAILKEKMTYKPSPSKWSKKEIMGHLIDSAQNNIRRFIVSQYEDTPHIVYKQDDWVALSNYQNYDLADLVNLWYLLNKHVVTVLKNMRPEMMERTCLTESPHSVEWLAKDYVRHLKHHLHQVLEIDPVPYP